MALSERPLRELALFAGAGGGILGGILLGWECVCAVEINPEARKSLLARQRDGCLRKFPIWDDVRTFDGKPWRGHVDVISGGFPCQDISPAGKGAGIDGERSGLWAEFARIIGEVRPRYVFVENSSALTVRGLGRVLGDLAALGYDARHGVVSAASAGCGHVRERIWIFAQPRAQRWTWLLRGVEGERIKSRYYWPSDALDTRCATLRGLEQRLGEPAIFGTDDGLADRVDRLALAGNGQVSRVVRVSWEILSP
jgi:DNA (cytosine-5)-methyltransferase 1